MPYKFNERRRHEIPKARYRVANWPKYDVVLVRRGSLTIWFTEEAVAAWHAPATVERGGQLVYSAPAIDTGLALRLVFHQPLRQTEGMLRSIAEALKIDIAAAPAASPSSCCSPGSGVVTPGEQAAARRVGMSLEFIGGSPMKRIVFALAGIGVLAGAVATTAPVSGQSEGEAAPIYGIKLPQGRRPLPQISRWSNSYKSWED